DLENACSQEDGLKKIIDFIGNDILIAHNGIDFDFNFINTKLKEYNLPILKNCLIDTLYISRSINEGFKSHSLEMISKKLKLSYESLNAHRADYDAKLLSDVWSEFIKILLEKGCNNVNDINDFIQSNQLRSATRGNFVNIYAKNQDGMKDIYKLVSLSHTECFASRPTIKWNLLNDHHKNLLITNLPIESDVISCALTKSDENLNEAISKYDFISICSPDGFYHEILNNNITKEEFQIARTRIINSANQQNKLLVATSNAYYLTEDDKQFHNLYVNLPILNKRNHRFKSYGTGPKMHYRTTEQMLNEFSFLNDDNLINDIVINNPNKILKLFNLPILPVKEKLYPPSIPGVNEKIKNEVYLNAHKMYGEKLPDIVESRIKKELDSIINHGYA
ncbi:MAG: PHP domain-containing protein, partial [Ureaplasma sp.]|nr:PHP domain-containing protein [Ureaplasma sp.]